MKIAMFHPTDRDRLFCGHSEHEFIYQSCDESCDVIYAASVSTLSQALVAKRKYNKPLVCWCWDIPYNWREWGMSEQGNRDNAFRDAVNNGRVKDLKECDLVITASKWVQYGIKEKYGIDSIQMYQYIDIDGLDSIPTQERQNKISQISRFFYNKKFHHTVIAARDTDYDVHFFGTGFNGNYGKEIKCEMNKYGTKVTINESPKRDYLIKSIKESKLLVSPSVFEGWGITPIESLYCGTPILLSDLPVFKEVYGDSFIYHKRNDPEDMKLKIEMILGDEKLQKRIVDEGQKIIKEFTPSSFAKRWDEQMNKIKND